MLFSGRDQGRDTKKEQALSMTFSQSDWFIPKKWMSLIGYYNEQKLPQEFWIERNDCNVGRLFVNIQLELFSYCKNSSRIIDFAAKHTHWHSQWCSHGKSQPKQWSLRQSMKSNLKLAPLEHEQTTAELASLLTRAFERMVEQFFNCFTDGLEL